jgi:alcohol dehydrogenase, propanol-preferring
MPLRPVLKKNLTIRSNETGTRVDMEEALNLSASGKFVCEVELVKLVDLNIALDRLQAGKVLGKLVLDLRSDSENLKSML